MPPAYLLLKEAALASLTSMVEKSRRMKPPFPEYDIRLDSTRLDFALLSKPSPSPNDEGFESDVDTLSIISSDDSRPELHHHGHHQESDSGNGSSSSSDSETDTSLPSSQTVLSSTPSSSNSSSSTLLKHSSYSLVDCMCYTDIKSPDTLVFVIKEDALVFRFQDLNQLQQFYTAFSTFKAIANQRTYCNNSGIKISPPPPPVNNPVTTTKFNLVQRTDNDGVTHLQVTKESTAEKSRTLPKNHQLTAERSDIISLNIPELKARNFLKQQQQHDQNFFNQQQQSRRSSSIENLLEDLGKSAKLEPVVVKGDYQRRVWNSAEDLLDAPRRPERRRRPTKAKAPLPPAAERQPTPPRDVMRGQYVRVNVTSSDIKLSYPSKIVHQQPSQQVIKEYAANFKPIQQQQQQHQPRPQQQTLLRYSPPQHQTTAGMGSSSWTNSIPRFLRKPRSQSETRNFTPMAYRYIDTTSHLQQAPQVSGRLFGMSSKLRDFGGSRKAFDSWGASDNRSSDTARRGSLGELAYKMPPEIGSLKSVIKKDQAVDTKRKNQEKKVTFSAYTTVQVV